MIQEKLDIVITWVDGSDPKWIEEFNTYAPDHLKKNVGNDCRYRDWGLFQYWFRGIEKFCPWVNKIHLITWGHLPSWLNTNHPKLNIVNHKDYIDPQYLPTFNSNPIELSIHKIKGLSDRFILFNDDFYIIAPTPSTRFFRNGLPVDQPRISALVPVEEFAHTKVNNMSLINRKFWKAEVLKNHWWKWFSRGFNIFHLITFLKGPYFTEIKPSHLPQPYLKSSWYTAWALWESALHKTSLNKFRDITDCNHWLIRDYQLVTGQFSPYRIDSDSYYRNVIPTRIPEIEDIIRNQKVKILCINDCARTYTKDFDKHLKIIRDAMDSIMPDKSEFEL